MKRRIATLILVAAVPAALALAPTASAETNFKLYQDNCAASSTYVANQKVTVPAHKAAGVQEKDTGAKTGSTCVKL